MLSLWRDNVCAGTFRLAADEVPDLIAMLRTGLDRVLRRRPRARRPLLDPGRASPAGSGHDDHRHRRVRAGSWSAFEPRNSRDARPRATSPPRARRRAPTASASIAADQLRPVATTPGRRRVGRSGQRGHAPRPAGRRPARPRPPCTMSSARGPPRAGYIVRPRTREGRDPQRRADVAADLGGRAQRAARQLVTAERTGRPRDHASGRRPGSRGGRSPPAPARSAAAVGRGADDHLPVGAVLTRADHDQPALVRLGLGRAAPAAPSGPGPTRPRGQVGAMSATSASPRRRRPRRRPRPAGELAVGATGDRGRPARRHHGDHAQVRRRRSGRAGGELEAGPVVLARGEADEQGHSSGSRRARRLRAGSGAGPRGSRTPARSPARPRRSAR